MNLFHNIINATGWFSNTDSTLTQPNGEQAQSISILPMDSDAGRVSNCLVHSGYNADVEKIRKAEYPQLQDITYLDHAGTTLYASSLIRRISDDLISNLYGNPHSQSPSSQLTSSRIKDIRLRTLQLFNASPETYDIIFCANATAGMKLVLEAYMAHKGDFIYRYHKDCHTSAVGIRELSNDVKCLTSDGEVDTWLESEPTHEELNEGARGLFAYPAQSNFSGRRLPLTWAGKLRKSRRNFFTLLDGAALVSTSPLDLSAVEPDFTVLSFYKMFGYPDLGAVIVRKASPGMLDFLQGRSYFGGGTVAAVTSQADAFHAKRMGVPHEHMEDGTLPFHSILALDAAMTVHNELFGNFLKISQHVTSLMIYLHRELTMLEHYNKRRVCALYTELSDTDSMSLSAEDWAKLQGPTLTFNIQRVDGGWVGYSEVEKLAAVKGIHIRTGGLCNPGGVESYIGLKAWEIIQNYEAGHRCWDDNDIMRGKPTGAIRISLGAMSTLDDVGRFLAFLKEFYVEQGKSITKRNQVRGNWGGKATGVVESITIYPIKSCGAFKIPVGTTWEIKPHGLAWDREWCLVHLGTGSAMNQKQYNQMALIRPSLDMEAGILNVTYAESSTSINISVAISDTESTQTLASRVCGDKINALMYSNPDVVEFFSKAIGVPCTLARFPASLTSKRHFKPHLATSQNGETTLCAAKQPPILLSNESPMLLINRSSVDHLNGLIKDTGGKAAKVDVFRANIVIAETGPKRAPYAEDTWKHVQIGKEYMELLGPCRRCHMVCIDQQTAVKNEEPFVTLSKTRRIDGRVLFGQHAMHLPRKSRLGTPGIKVGDLVRVLDNEPRNLEITE